MEIVVAVMGLDEMQKNRLTRARPGASVVFTEALPDAAARQAAVARAEVVFGNVPAAWLAAAPKLRWVQLDSAGVDAYLKVNDGRATPLALTHLHGFFDWACSECALAGLLGFYRQLPRLLVAQPEKRWIKNEVEPSIGKLHGARVVILGAGGIAQCLGRLLEAFDCSVTYFARRSPLAKLRSLSELDAALSATDVLVSTLPHTPETVNLIDAARLARLPSHAVLVNVGRGSTVDEEALLAALEAGRLAGAVLDVTRIEPLPVESPLWRHPQVVLTQHTGGRFPGEAAAKVDVFLENLGRFERGEALRNRVDPARGY